MLFNVSVYVSVSVSVRVRVRACVVCERSVCIVDLHVWWRGLVLPVTFCAHMPWLSTNLCWYAANRDQGHWENPSHAPAYVLPCPSQPAA
jgi:hypothetical protein